MRKSLLLATLLLVMAAAAGGSPVAGQERAHGISSIRDVEAVYGTREQAELMDRLLKRKVATVLPAVMRRAGADMWIVRNNEGPIYLSLLPSDDDGHVAEWTPFIVLHDRGAEAGVERTGARFDDLAGMVQARDPDRIVINDGFGADHRAELVRRIGAPYADRLTSDSDLAIWWLEARTPQEISIFRHVIGIAHDVIGEGYSNRVIVPDVTTTNDLNWWIRQRYIDLGIDTDDHPTVTVQRSRAERARYGDPDEYFRIDTSPRNGMDIVIRRGDLLFNDTGIRYLGINTDTQQAAYVLMPGETAAPAGLKEAMRHLNRLQDIIGEEMQHGRTGREIGMAASARARQEGIRPRIYAHPISYWFMRYQLNGGFFTRDHYFAGTAITDEPSDDPGDDRDRGPRYDLRGPPFHYRLTSADHPLEYNTVYALEIDIEYPVPEWEGLVVRLHSETVTAFTPDGLVYPAGRQTEWYLIR